MDNILVIIILFLSITVLYFMIKYVWSKKDVSYLNFYELKKKELENEHSKMRISDLVDKFNNDKNKGK